MKPFLHKEYTTTVLPIFDLLIFADLAARKVEIIFIQFVIVNGLPLHYFLDPLDKRSFFRLAQRLMSPLVFCSPVSTISPLSPRNSFYNCTMSAC